MNAALETYLHELNAIRSSGAAVTETSFYPPLVQLLNQVGKTLKPRVYCFNILKNTGAGHPDGGLFTHDQLQKGEAAPSPNVKPSRGVLEVKGTGEAVEQVAQSEQVARYLAHYGQALVTNYRDFLLVERGADGLLVRREGYHLAHDEAAFWAIAASPAKARQAARDQEERFVEFLKRALLSGAALQTPREVAWYLASYARDAKSRIENHGMAALAPIRESLEDALGITFQGERADHFFRSTLVQTLFYGVFSAWVLWHKEEPGRTDRFDWRDSAQYLHVPLLQTLFWQVSQPSQLKDLQLTEVLGWTGDALNRVERPAFFDAFEAASAVQYFYEPFLEAFDPQLRKELGVWYTPPEIVRYMVARVDAVLKTELDLPLGLADPNVYVLDPCCGTGAYLVEVLRHVADTLGDDALAGAKLKKAATERVFGFEILPAPFVVAHLQISLLLANLRAPLAPDGKERAGVYLTNALTGWDPPKDGAPQKKLLFPDLEEERDRAEAVKREKPILVVLGNPPYNAFAGVSPVEEKGLVEPYKTGLNTPVEKGGWGIKKFNLDDLYVRFFRIAERRVGEAATPGRGVVCFISNFSYLSDPSFVAMRARFLAGFDALWFDSLNGDSRETGKLTPQGKPDPSAFSTPTNREGIRVGTAIGLMVRRAAERGAVPVVRFRQFWGVTKRADLLESLQEPNADAGYALAAPTRANRHSFRPSNVVEQYEAWPKLTELSAEQPFVGLEECRGGALIDVDKVALERRMQMYYETRSSWESLQMLGTGLARNAVADLKVRSRAQAAEQYQLDRLSRYTLRPFDTRWCYYTEVPGVWNRPRPTLRHQCWEGNRFLISRFNVQASPEGVPMCISTGLFDKQTISRNPGAFPLLLRPAPLKKEKKAAAQDALFDQSNTPTANLSPAARAYLATLGIENPDADEETAGLIWMHALAIGYSPAYLAENADGIRQDWPRIPLPATQDALRASAQLGRQLAALLDTEKDVPGVTAPPIAPPLAALAVITRAGSSGGGQLNPDAGDLALTAGWGHAGKNGVTMPGKGRIIARPADPNETADSPDAQTLDVYLNPVAYFRNVPPRVWNYTVGGYQVLKKWLSYREKSLLQRDLTLDEAQEVTHMARRIAAILRLEPLLDANYQAVKQATHPWTNAAVGREG